MTHHRAEGARIARSRSGRMVSVASLALLAPLMLSACVSDGDKLSGTADISPTRTAAAAPAAAEPAGGTRTPARAASAKPAAETSTAETRGARVVARKAAPEEPSLGSRALGTAVAAKDSVVSGASQVGAKAAAVATLSAATIQNVAQAAKDTITGNPEIDRMIAAAADENDIPRELAYAVVRVESHYNPRAKGAGVYGLSQIKPATARGLGFSGPTEALFDPETNLRYGMRYLKGAWEKGGGDVCQAAMKYKGGHRTTTMSRSASVYCSNVKRHMAAIRARKTPAMSDTATLVAAVEPTVRQGVVARTVAAKPAEARGETKAPETKATTAATVRTAAAQRAPAVAAAAAPAPAAPTPAAVALNAGETRPATGAAAAAAAVSAPVPAPRPAVPAPSVHIAENEVAPLVAPSRADESTPTGGRVTHRSQPQIDRDRFGGAFDASTPAPGASTPGASAPAAGSLGFN